MGARGGHRSLQMRRLALAIGTVLLASGSTVVGHEGATGIVKERMDDMKRIGRAVKRINDRLLPARQFAEIALEADVIGKAAARMPSLFPPGSHAGHTEATAAIWTRWSDFVAGARLLADEAEKLSRAARSGQHEAVLGHVRSVTRSCGGCHEPFRAKR